MDEAELLAMQQYLMSLGIDPQMLQYVMGVAPSLKSSGEPEPYDVDAQSKVTNQWQNIMSSLADNMNSMVAGGAGAYGFSPTGGGIAGGGGLNPLITETVVETPILNQLNFQAQQQGTLEGLIASGLLSNTPASLILADLQAKVEGDDPNVDETTRQLLARSLPQKPVLDPAGNETGETTVDWNQARSELMKQADAYTAEAGQINGLGTNSLGQFVTRSETPSPTMEWLQKMGLPDPRAQYGVEYAAQNDPDLAALVSNMQTKSQDFEEAQAAYKKYLKDLPQLQMLEGQRKRSEANDERRQKLALQKYILDSTNYSTVPGSRQVRQALEGAASGAEAGGNFLSNAFGNISRGVPGAKMAAGLAGKLVPGLEGGVRAMGLADDLPRAVVGGGGRREGPNLPGRSMLTMLLSGIGDTKELGRQRHDAMWRANRSLGEDVLSLIKQTGPLLRYRDQGRTPFGDAIQQRMAPLAAMGAIGR